MGALFGKTKAPTVNVQAPATEQPVREPVEPEIGADSQLTEEQKKRRGKAGLRIDRDPVSVNTGVSMN